MIKEQNRLLVMLKENKISEADYLLISAALNKKSVFTNIENSLLINPFQKIAGFRALLLGLLLMITMSLLGVVVNIYFDGSLGFFFPMGLKAAIKPNFFLLLYQNAAAVFITASLFMATALLFRKNAFGSLIFWHGGLGSLPFIDFTSLYDDREIFRPLSL